MTLFMFLRRIDRPRPLRGLFILCLLLMAARAWAYPAESGGDTSVRKDDVNAFSLPSNNMSFERRVDFSVGNSFFRNPWVTAPSSTAARDGLGPLFNTNGCQNCHIKDGRGHLPAENDHNVVSMLLRISVPARSKEDWERLYRFGALIEPVYGGQIQDFAVPGLEPEAQLAIHYEYQQVELAGGETAELRKPVVKLESPGYGPIREDLQMSLRMAPPMIGLGLLEAIPETTLRKFADEDDRDDDGISGRLNQVWSEENQDFAVGRFGWKAEQPTLKQQNAAAFAGDLGITSTLFPQDDCTPAQEPCLKAPNGGSPELSDRILDLVTFYSRNLAVPVRRNVDDPQVKQGANLFAQSGCEGCHKTNITTATLPDQPEQSAQLIHPYTDLLLHDMGEGLSDGRPVFKASGREWRTPPLWGIGLTEVVSGSQHYLHDGRARTLLEAILWHDGEARASRDKVRNMTPAERQALLAFLRSL